MPGIAATSEITCTGASGESQTWRTSGPTAKDERGRTTFTDETGAHIVVAGDCHPKA